MKTISGASFDEIKRQVRDRKDRQWLSVTTYQSKTLNVPHGEPTMARPLNAESLREVSAVLDQSPHVRSALVDNEFIVDADSITAARSRLDELEIASMIERARVSLVQLRG